MGYIKKEEEPKWIGVNTSIIELSDGATEAWGNGLIQEDTRHFNVDLVNFNIGVAF